MMAARSGHGGRNSIDGGQGVSCADWVGASWRGPSVGRMAGQRAGCRRQAGNGRARLNWVSQGQRWGRCKVRRRAERVSRPAIEKKRRRRVLVVTTGPPRPMRAVQRSRLCAITWTASQAASYLSRSLPASADGAFLVADFAHNSATLGSLVDQRLQLSSRIRCSGLLSPEAADFVLELADAGSGLLGAGELVLVGEDGPLRRWVDPE